MSREDKRGGTMSAPRDTFTRGERERIRSAWSALCAVAKGRSDGSLATLELALKLERPSRGINSARLVVSNCWLGGFLEPDKPAHRLQGYAAGCRLALILGARAGAEHGRSEPEDWRLGALIRDAEQASREHSRRLIDCIAHRV